MNEKEFSDKLQLIDEKSFKFWYEQMKNAIKNGILEDAEVSQVQMIRFFRGDRFQSTLSQIKINEYYKNIIQFIIHNENGVKDDLTYLRLSLCHLAIGDYLRAFKYIGLVDKKDDLPHEYYFILGICNVYFKRFKIAIDFFKISELSDDNIIKFDSIYLKAFSLSKIGNIDESVSQFQLLNDPIYFHPQVAKEDIEFQLACMVNQISNNKPNSSLTPYFSFSPTQTSSIYLSLENKNIDIISLQRAFELIQNGKYRDAFDALNNITIDYTSKYDRSLLMGYCFYNQYDYSNAYRCLYPLLAFDQIGWPIWFLVGLILIRTGRFQNAMAAFGNARAANVSSTKTLLNLASSCELDGQLKDAEKIYNEIPENDSFYQYAKSRIIYIHAKFEKSFEIIVNPEIFEISIQEFYEPPSERAASNFINCPLLLSKETVNFLGCEPDFSEIHKRVTMFPKCADFKT